jgi:hypothetical protein
MAVLAKWRLVLSAIGLPGLVLASGCFGLFGPQDTNLSQQEAVAAAQQSADYIIHDEPISDTNAERTTYAEVAQDSGSGGDTPGEALVWKVIFKGMFYEPEGPAADVESTQPVRMPVCGEVTVVVEDATAQGLILTFARSNDC